MPIPAIIGAVLKIAPIIIPLVEKIIPIPKSGKEKMSLVSEIIRSILNKVDSLTMPNADGTARPTITDDELVTTIETVFQRLKEGNGLNVNVTDPDTIYIIRGTITPLALHK